MKETLKSLVEILGKNDRLCLIEFSNYSSRLTNLKTVTNENKNFFKEKINKIFADGGITLNNNLKELLFYKELI